MPGRLVCFVCGNVGAETSIHVKPQDTGPFFPFLEHHDPPKGSRQPAYDGSVDCCRVCFAFLTTQWELYERSKTPAIKRLYWLKRADNGNFTGAEMRLQGEYIAQVMGLQYQPGSFELDTALSPENPAVEPNFHTRSHNNVSRPQPQPFSHHIPHDQRETDSSKPFDSALDLSTPKKELDHFKTSNGPDVARTPDSQDFICFVCGQQQNVSYGSYINIFQQHATEPYFPVLESIKPYPGSEHITRSGQAKVCGHCKNILYQQWQAYEISGTPVSLRTYKIPAKLCQSETKNLSKRVDSRGDLNTSYVCYICGISNTVENANLLNTLPPKSPSLVVMFFPFIRELDRPRGAEPLRPDGSVLACVKCYGSLSYQWQVQEVEGVPLYHRNYSLHFLSVKQPMQEIKSSAQNSDSEPVKPLNIQISMASPVQKNQDPVTSVFPTTQGLLAIAPVLSSEESNSPSKFHDSMINSKTTVSDSTIYTGGVKTVPHPLQQVTDIPKKVCFLCGERCLISRMHYLNAYPARHEAKHASAQMEPFFPFLTSCEPATKADPVTEEGIVIACKICYHTLVKQWSEFEQSKHQGDSNRWLRKYSIPNYPCYLCAAVCERKYLRSLETDKFQFLREHKAPSEALVMDDGEKVAVCKPCAYSLMKQYTEFERMGLPAELRKYNWMHKAPVMFDEGAPDDESLVNTNCIIRKAVLVLGLCNQIRHKLAYLIASEAGLSLKILGIA